MIAPSLPLEDFLAATPVVDRDHPEVVATARRIVDGAGGSDAKRVRRLFEWVRDQVPHTADIGGEVVTCAASEVLAAGTGICYAKSHLLAALCRAVGVPAGFCYQRLRKDPPYEGFELHGFNAAFLSEHDRWVRVDPRGNKPGIDAQFSLEEERLAFPIDVARGETTFPTIYATPAREVVEALKRHTRLSELWPELPDRLEEPL